MIIVPYSSCIQALGQLTRWPSSLARQQGSEAPKFTPNLRASIFCDSTAQTVYFMDPGDWL